MECLINLEDEKPEIKYGDILIYSRCQAYLIVEDYTSDVVAKAIQIFNNGNEELGMIDYSGETLDILIDALFRDFGKPVKIVNIKDVLISL